MERMFTCQSCFNTFAGHRDKDGDVISYSESSKPKRFQAAGCPRCGFFECSEDDIFEEADTYDTYEGFDGKY